MNKNRLRRVYRSNVGHTNSLFCERFHSVILLEYFLNTFLRLESTARSSTEFILQSKLIQRLVDTRGIKNTETPEQLSIWYQRRVCVKRMPTCQLDLVKYRPSGSYSQNTFKIFEEFIKGSRVFGMYERWRRGGEFSSRLM